ncbi:MAG: hypothetical protein KJ709_00560 [Nanoarchaeota archaeon]|nr:hypothetical protein [Nanoarchaeota archaeon]
MTNPEIISEQPMMLSELKDELTKAKKRDKELSFRAQKAEDYMNSIYSLKPAQAKELFGKLEMLSIPRLKDVHMMKIVDLLPLTVESLKVILQGYTLTVNQDNMKKIVNVVKVYLPEQKEPEKKSEKKSEKK